MSTMPAMPPVGHPAYAVVANKRWRLRHPDRHRKSVREQHERVARMLRLLIGAEKDKGCFDCGKLYPHWILQFDHVPERGKKLFKILASTPRGIKAFKAEMAKCDVVCANCHMDRTYRRSKEEIIYG